MVFLASSPWINAVSPWVKQVAKICSLFPVLALGNKIPKPKWRPLGNSKAEFRFRSRTSPSEGLQRVWFKRFLFNVQLWYQAGTYQPNVQSDFHFKGLKNNNQKKKKQEKRRGEKRKGGAFEVSSFKLQNENAGRAPGETSRKSKFQPWGREKVMNSMFRRGAWLWTKGRGRGAKAKGVWEIWNYFASWYRKKDVTPNTQVLSLLLPPTLSLYSLLSTTRRLMKSESQVFLKTKSPFRL